VFRDFQLQVEQHVPALVIGLAGAVSAGLALRLAAGRADAFAIALIGPLWTLLVVAAIRRTDPPLLLVAMAALGVRLVLIGSPPLLSDDLFRYLWEGHLLAAGGNPFTTPPSAVSGLADALRAEVNHPDIPSIYPPIALWWFRGLHASGGTPTVAQAWAMLADVGTAVLIGVAARKRIGAAWPGLLYAIHPRPAHETAVSGHLEGPAVLLLAPSVVAHDRGLALSSGLVGMLGAGTKLFPAVIVPSLRAPRAAMGAVLGAMIVLVAAVPVLDAGPALFDAFGTYTTNWSFNGFAYPWVTGTLGAWDRAALVTAGAAVAVGAYVRHRDPVDVWLTIGAAFLFLTPTAHPWYALWALVPALINGRRDYAFALGWLTVAYAVLSTIDAEGAWREPWWLWPLTWVPIVITLAASAVYPAATSVRNGTEAG
jgi:hypothetical protein